MNFKPTSLKIAVSLVIALIVNYCISQKYLAVYDVMCKPGFACPTPSWLTFAFDPAVLISTIVVFAGVYSIMSLQTAKKSKKPKKRRRKR